MHPPTQPIKILKSHTGPNLFISSYIASDTGASSDDKSDKLSPGGIAGIVIGSTAAVLLVIYLIYDSERKGSDEHDIHILEFDNEGGQKKNSWTDPEPTIEVVGLAGYPKRRRTLDYRLVESPNSLMKQGAGSTNPAFAGIAGALSPLDEHHEIGETKLPGSPV